MTENCNNKTFLGQSSAFYLIFLVEIWERFGFYGVQALLVLFMVQSLHFADRHADILFASFSALVFLLPPIGGLVGDRVLGTKRTILLGAVTLAIGYLLLALPGISSVHLALPLAVIAVGNGLFKANPSSLLSKVYSSNNRHADSGFTLYYMAINIGSFTSVMATPVLNSFFGWHVAFSVCFLGLVLAIINYLSMHKVVGHVGSKPDFKPLNVTKLFYVIVGIVALVGVSEWLLSHDEIMATLLMMGALILIAMFFMYMKRANKKERIGMWLFFILFIQGIVFFVLYFQMFSSLMLFALRNVRHSVLGIPIQPASFQAFSSLWILLLSPVLAMIYQKLHQRREDATLPLKFALGTFFAGISFIVLFIGTRFANTEGLVSSYWMIFAYIFQAVGELMVSALGMSLVARYVPQRIVGFTMGLWFLSTAIASLIAGNVASLAGIAKDISHDPLKSLPIYGHLFLQIGLVTICVAVIMFIFVPKLNRLSRESDRVRDIAVIEAPAAVIADNMA